MIVIYCNDYFFTVDLALHRLSFRRGPVKPTINETFSETEVVTRGGSMKISRDLIDNQTKKKRPKGKKTPTMRIALGPVIPCMIFFHKEWQQLPANLLCILFIPLWHNCQNIMIDRCSSTHIVVHFIWASGPDSMKSFPMSSGRD